MDTCKYVLRYLQNTVTFQMQWNKVEKYIFKYLTKVVSNYLLIYCAFCKPCKLHCTSSCTHTVITIFYYYRVAQVIVSQFLNQIFQTWVNLEGQILKVNFLNSRNFSLLFDSKSENWFWRLCTHIYLHSKLLGICV